MIVSYFEQLAYWHWLVFGIVLIVLETLAPGAIFIWMGVAAALVGVIMLITPIIWPIQFIIFAVASVASIVLWRKYQKANPRVSTSPMLGHRARRYIGRQVTIATAVEHGHGSAWLGDTVWSVEGPDMPVDAIAEVVDARGTVLIVKRADKE